MKLHIKPFLLSTFVLPGLGQLHKGDRVKGIILVVLVNIFLVTALFLVLKGLGPLIASSYLSSSPAETAKMVEQVQAQSPVTRYLLGAFIGLWLYGSVDAAFSSPKNP